MTARSPAQSNPSAATDTDLFTATAATVCSTLSVCNQGATNATYRVSIRPAGGTLAAKMYVVYEKQIAPNQTDFITIGQTLANTDVVTVRASTANLSFNLSMDY